MNMFGFGFSMFSIMFNLMFFLVFGIILVTLFRNLMQWNKNNHSPELSVSAIVVGKRQNVSHHHHGDSMHHSTSTTYYVTFEVQSGDRMEFIVDGHEYGQLIEGDAGRLTFQGTRYLGFERMRNY